MRRFRKPHVNFRMLKILCVQLIHLFLKCHNWYTSRIVNIIKFKILIVQVGNIIYQLSDSVALKYLHASESPVELVKT